MTLATEIDTTIEAFDYIDWLIHVCQRESVRRRDGWLVETLGDIISAPKAPEFLDRDMEMGYRSGYADGYVRASQDADRLHRLGYTRAPEIASMLFEHWRCRLQAWRLSHKPGSLCFPPAMTARPWREVSKEVLGRDDFRCACCGSQKHLEIHHEHPVKDGGLPLPSNLVTLCRRCHKSGRFQ